MKTDIGEIKKEIEKQYENKNEANKKIDEGQSNLESKIDAMNTNISNQIENGFSGLRNKISNLGNKISELRNEINNGFKGLQGYLAQLFSVYFGGKEPEFNTQNNSKSDSEKEKRTYRLPNIDGSIKRDIDQLSYPRSNKSEQQKKNI